MNNPKNGGFSAVGVVALLFVVFALAAAAWIVHSRGNKPDSATTKQVSTKVYRNAEYGFSFSYPAGWTLSEKMQDLGRGHLEGAVNVVSKAGVTVSFQPNLGGKGGDCTRDPGDVPQHTKSCSTLEVLSLDKLPAANGLGAQPVYLYHAAYTPAGPDAQTAYTLFIENGSAAPTQTGPIIGAISARGVINPKIGYVYDDVTIRGTGASTASYFDNPDVRQAEDILRSFKLLQ